MDCRLPDGYCARPDSAAPLQWPNIRSQQAVFEFGCHLAARSQAPRLIVIGCRSPRVLLDAPAAVMVVDAEAMRRLFDEADAATGDTVVSYCHIGQQASLVYFAARYLGFDVRLYDGSFQDWSRRTDLPVVATPAKPDAAATAPPRP